MIGQSRRSSVFARIADRAAHLTGSPRGFVLAVTIVVVWAVSGPFFGFSNTWQLVINTGTTVVTFLMVFLLQATQNRDSAAIHLKLDELVRATQGASNELLDMETLTPETLDELRRDYELLAEKARARAK
jgi:low affinity Fe/Cu permease